MKTLTESKLNKLTETRWISDFKKYNKKVFGRTISLIGFAI